MNSWYSLVEKFDSIAKKYNLTPEELGKMLDKGMNKYINPEDMKTNDYELAHKVLDSIFKLK